MCPRRAPRRPYRSPTWRRADASSSRKVSDRQAGRSRCSAKPNCRSSTRRSHGNFVAKIGGAGEGCGKRRVARQFGNDPFAQADPVPSCTRRRRLDLHLRHVDAGRTFAPAGLAGDAQLQRLRNVARGQRVLVELAGEGEPKRIGSATNKMLLVARRPIARTHRAGVELTAMAVVVAHLDGAHEAAERPRIVRPVELRREALDGTDSRARSGTATGRRSVAHGRSGRD